MKVVLFCGGQGLRLREYSDAVPKPMAIIGNRPLLWHLMRYYAHYGHTDFILCVGWKGRVIRDYFRHNPQNTDGTPWNLTFVDSGVRANVGQRLKAAQPYLESEEEFLANYADGLSDVHLPELIDFAHGHGGVATFLAVRPKQSSHVVEVDASGRVCSIERLAESKTWINGGYFLLRREIFDYMHDGDELVEKPFQRLIAAGQLFSMKHEGFWDCMDTYKEKQMLDDIVARGDAPWEVWKQPRDKPSLVVP
jgi:glucose-1-phosphate cytidylyltransferase